MLYNNSAARRVYKLGISKYIQDIQDIHKIPSPGPAPRGQAGQGGPAAAWYFVYILYIFYILDILNIFGYIPFVHPAGRRIIVKHLDRSIDPNQTSVQNQGATN